MLVMEEDRIVRQEPQDLYNLPLDLATAKYAQLNIFSGALMQDVINQARSKKLSSARIGKASYCTSWTRLMFQRV